MKISQYVRVIFDNIKNFSQLQLRNYGMFQMNMNKPYFNANPPQYSHVTYGDKGFNEARQQGL